MIDFDRYLGIQGIRNSKLNDVTAFLNRVRRRLTAPSIQFFNANLIAGQEHLYFAVLNALSAFKNNLNISATLSVETLLYASAQRQIKRAVEMLGVKPNTTDIAVLVIGKTEEEARAALHEILQMLSGEPDDKVLGLTDEKARKIQEAFKISDLALDTQMMRQGDRNEALVNLVLEHMALLTVQK
jgi:KEOPS complex subunit Cgi121